MKAVRLKEIELRVSKHGLSAWIDGKYLGAAHVTGDQIIIVASAAQAVADVVMPEYLVSGHRDGD